MSHGSFAEVWLTVDDVVALGRSERRVLLNIAGKNPKWESKPVPRVGPHGRPSKVIALESLPEELQRRWLAQQIVVPDPSDAVITDSPFPDTYSSDNIDQNPREKIIQDKSTEQLQAEHRLTEALQQFPSEVREAVMDEARRLESLTYRYLALPNKRQRVVNLEVAGSSPAVRARSISAPGTSVAEMADAPDPGSDAPTLRAAAGYEFTPAVHALCKEAVCTNPILIDYYKSRQHKVRSGSEPRCTKPISPSTLDDWSRRMRKDGLLAFLPAPSNGRKPADPAKDKRRAKISPEAVDWINRNYKSKPHAGALYEDLQKAARRHGWIIPHVSWVYRKWRDLPKIVMMTKKEYVAKAAPYYPRDNRDLESLQIVCGDHSERDVTVRLPDGSLTRPWLTLWQCVRNLLIWGWYLALTPSSRTIGLAYANGVRTFGAQPLSRPEEEFFSYAYTDQGKDYRGHTIAGKTINYGHAAAIEGGFGFLCAQRRVGLIDELGLKHLVARGYNAREKPVERTHRDISGWEARTFDAEYCGADAKNKPDNWIENYARHQRLLKRVDRTGSTSLLDESPFMAIDDYREALTGYFFEYNHAAHERSTLGGARVVPIEEHNRLYTTRYEISEKTLAMILMKSDSRKPRKNGVNLNGFQYLHPSLGYYHGMDVEVRYSDDDYRRVWIFPPPTATIPYPPMIEAEAVIRGGMLNPNRETQKMVAKQRKFEEQIRRDHQMVLQSKLRGETVEDRAAAQLEPEEEIVEAIAAVAGGNGGGAFGGQGRAPLATASGPGFASPSARMPGDDVGVVHQATVHLLTGYDRRANTARPKSRPVTVDEVAEVEVDESIFESEETNSSSSVVKMWDDEED